MSAVSTPFSTSMLSESLGCHPMDSSRLLMSLLDLSREGIREGERSLVPQMVLRSLLRALQQRDEATLQHSRRVAMLCVGIAQNLKWEPESIRLLEIAGLLHDLGKIGVPDHILFKPGKLSPDEAELISVLHGVGVDLLQACRLPTPVIEMVSMSQESCESRRTRTEHANSLVHQGARILSIADAYDSMNTDQVFRGRMPHEQIMRVLTDQAGKRFDRNLVYALNRWMDEGGLSLIADDHEDSLPPIESLPDGLDEFRRAGTLSHLLSYLYLLESLYDGFYIVDADLRIGIWNGGAQRLFEQSAGQVLGESWTRAKLHLFHAKGRPLNDGECPLLQVMSDRRPACGTLSLHLPRREPVILEVQSLPLIDADGKLAGVAEIFRDTSRAKRNPGQYRELRMAATQDPLTGVANRGELERRIDELFDLHAVSEKTLPFSVVFFDIDHFKQINDKYLHTTGDRVLINLAKLVQDELYSGEVIGRYGGEEFVVLCPETELDDAVRKAERLRRSIEMAGLGNPEGFDVTASFGVAQYMPGDTRESLLDRADKALFDAKEQGRNRTCLRTPHQSPQDGLLGPQADLHNPRIYEDSIVACVGADLVIHKLGGFVDEYQAEVLDVDEGKLHVRLGRSGLFGGWGKTEERQPIEVYLVIGKEAVDRRRTKRVEIQVTIRPIGRPKVEMFHARCHRVIQNLRAFLVAD